MENGKQSNMDQTITYIHNSISNTNNYIMEAAQSMDHEQLLQFFTHIVNEQKNKELAILKAIYESGNLDLATTYADRTFVSSSNLCRGADEIAASEVSKEIHSANSGMFK